MGLVRIHPEANQVMDRIPEMEQVLATVSFKLDTRFNEYLSKATPEQRRLLRSLRTELFHDITWLLDRCAGLAGPSTRSFDGGNESG